MTKASKKFIPISKPTITQREIDYVTDAVKSTWVSSLGEYIEEFEDKFARFCGTQYAISTSNGTTALHLALVAAGVKSGDEVIIPDLTFVATANAVKYINAVPVFVDINEDSLCIDPEAIEKAITNKSKAIIPVHLYGHPANMKAINQLAEKHNLLVIEDCAEAHGATINDKRIGSFSNAGVFSFYGNKVITTGEGGMITTDNRDLFEKMKFLRDHAMDPNKRYWHTEVGFNYRMTNLQAALGVAQFDRFDEILNKKKEIFNWYREGLKGIEGIKLNSQLPGYTNVYWMVCLEIMNYSEKERDALLVKMRELGIDSRPYFYPISDMPMYAKANTPISHKVAQRGLNLPSYFDLTKDEVLYICEQIRELI
ncbi:MAG: DegT/DnrJ/EryC1/StrS family aminotransferase [Crocinitomicaceae bacterium]